MTLKQLLTQNVGCRPPVTVAWCSLHDQKCPVPLDGLRQLSHNGMVAKLEIQIL